MKTVTTYAEKKAKQFLNLLQGYTKGIRFTAILILLLMGVSNVWGASVTPKGKYFYFKTSDTWKVDGARFAVCFQWKDGGGQDDAWVSCIGVPNVTDMYYVQAPDKYWDMYFCRMNGSNQTNSWSNKWNQTGKLQYDGTKNYWTKSSGWNENTTYSTYAPPLSSVTLENNGTSIVSGSGTSSSPYLVYTGTTIKVKASGTKAVNDPDATMYYNFKQGDTSKQDGTSTTYSFTASSTVNTSYTINLDGYTKISSTSSTKTSATALYFKTIENTYTVTIKNDGHGTTTPSGAQSNVGQVTGLSIQATPAANYEFVNWTITSGSGSFGSTTNASTTFKPTSAATIQANFRSTATNSLTVVAGAGIASVTGSQDPVTLGSTNAITATPKTGYTFSTWTANPAANAAFGSATTANTTVTVKNGSVTVTASATENKSTLTTSNKYDAGDPGYEVPAASVNSIGYETTATITATTDDDYTLTSWTLTNCTRTDGGADNATTITVRSNGDGKAATVTANYTENPCVYFVNTARWTTINAYAWNDTENNGWPGKAMTKEPEKISGYDVYKYVTPSGKNYDKLVFNQGNDDGKTGDLEWINGKYYVYSAGQWVDKNEVADLLPKPVIYFKNNPKWKEVYVYFHTGDYWSDANNGGSGSQGLASGRVCKMEKVGETDIYKYDYEASGIVPGNVIAFTEAKQTNHNHFHKTQAVYRTDYNPNMELFIPQATYETKNETKYFNKGLWMKYNSMESGYTITGSMNSWNQDDDKFTSSSHTGYHFDIELSLGGGQTYEFQVKNIKNDWYGKQNTKITATKADLELGISDGDTYNVKLTTTSAGNYIFSIDLTEGKMMVSVEYPLQVNDYRLVYVESEVSGKTPYTKFHPAQSIRYQATGEKKDTVSFYINKTTGKNPAILLQQCTNISGANITWTDVAIQNINGNGGATPTAALAPAKRAGELYVGGGSDITTNGVYNFTLSQTDGTAKILNEETHPYTGDYYIRTDAADGGWRKYNTNPDNIMTHSQIALTYGGYDYYFCKWVENANTNIKYTIANDYNYCVSDTLDGDTIATAGTLPAKANVRFTWNSNTNTLKRGYISGSSTASDRYLVLEGNKFLLDVEGDTLDIEDLEQHEALFEDMGNWVYQLDVQANNKTAIKLTAKYNGKVQTFFSTDTVANATSSDYYKVRFVYDFKTNNLVAAWLLEDENEVDGGKSLNSNMFIIRKHHEQAQQIKLNDDLSGVGTAYGVMTFDKYFLNNRYSEGDNKGTELPENQRKSIYERALYWVSFPFDVRIRDVFGFGDYMDTWILEYYDGEARAKNGAWVDSETYWTYITNLDDTLKAGTGYVLCLDLEKMQYNSSVFRNTDEVSLYFPSTDTIGTIKSDQAVSITLPAHECTITRDDRNIYDSNWHVIGVPRFINLDIELTNIKQGATQDEVIFYYEYIPATDDYKAAQSTGEKTFQTMSAYMVQFAGTINWWEEANFPSSLAARRNTNAKTKSANLRLELTQDEAMVDQTFIQLQEEGATAEFDMNKDLTKIMNQGANIYSLIGNSRIRTAGNVLPLEEVVVPVGVTVSTAGTYTFAMPDGTDGITAILIDYETGKETNLLIADYTTELREGTNNERFALRVRPNHVATEVETIIDGANGQIQKYIINGALYILNNGQLYDAQGRMVQQ